MPCVPSGEVTLHLYARNRGSGHIERSAETCTRVWAHLGSRAWTEGTWWPNAPQSTRLSGLPGIHQARPREAVRQDAILTTLRMRPRDGHPGPMSFIRVADELDGRTGRAESGSNASQDICSAVEMALCGTLWHGFGGGPFQKANSQHKLGQCYRGVGTPSLGSRKKSSRKSQGLSRPVQTKRASKQKETKATKRENAG